MNSGIPAEYCRQKAAATGTGFYYCTLYCPPDIKRDLYALHALANELAEVLADCTDAGVARMKLGWWAEESQRLIAGQARHPVTRELSALRARFPATDTVVMQLIRQHDLQFNFEQPESYRDLLEFLMQGAGSLWQLSAEICGYRHPHTPRLIAALGCQFAWFQIMQNHQRNRQYNRNYWPREELAGTVEDRDFYAFQIKRLVGELESGMEKIPHVDRGAQLPALIMARIVSRTCGEIANSGYRLHEEQVQLTPLRKLWIAWRTHRQYKHLS